MLKTGFRNLQLAIRLTLYNSHRSLQRIYGAPHPRTGDIQAEADHLIILYGATTNGSPPITKKRRFPTFTWAESTRQGQMFSAGISFTAVFTAISEATSSTPWFQLIVSSAGNFHKCTNAFPFAVRAGTTAAPEEMKSLRAGALEPRTTSDTALVRRYVKVKATLLFRSGVHADHAGRTAHLRKGRCQR